MSKLGYIVGYTYNAENYCENCILNAGGIQENIGYAFSVEGVLDVIASFMDINRNDESTFDSATFPKVIFRYQISEEERCSACNNRI